MLVALVVAEMVPEFGNCYSEKEEPGKSAKLGMVQIGFVVSYSTLELGMTNLRKDCALYLPSVDELQ